MPCDHDDQSNRRQKTPARPRGRRRYAWPLVLIGSAVMALAGTVAA